MEKTKLEEKLTRYERARIIGARALQISMGAPLLLKLKKEEFENLHFSPIEIAKLEFLKGILPITIKRPVTLKRE
ncbi:MAG: DNA-directed RNA polymerase subunit K [Nanoarchaeota archaeon]|nr:DNA-directed RNA polymerase subunit K [Nanoarchaeota archaeon]MBU0962389.1 DNA-directed RNA polymerase subunit K [Nanoarchaeota archaeon]